MKDKKKKRREEEGADGGVSHVCEMKKEEEEHKIFIHSFSSKNNKRCHEKGRSEDGEEKRMKVLAKKAPFRHLASLPLS